MAYFKNRRPQTPLQLELLESRRVLTTLAGTVYEDANDNGSLDVSDPRLPGVLVYLDSNENGSLERRGFGIDPDEFSPGEVLNNARQSVFTSATGGDNLPAFRVLASDELSRSTTGQRVFGLDNTTDWGTDRRLRFDFTVPVDSVSLDAVGSSALSEITHVRLDAFGTDGQLVESVAVPDLGNGMATNLEIARSSKDISFAVAYVVSENGAVKFDNLRADDAGSERATLSADSGFYRFTNVPVGSTVVAQVAALGYAQVTPEDEHRVEVVDGGIRQDLNFGNQTGSVAGTIFEDLGTPGPYDPNTDRAIEGVGIYIDSNRNGIPDTNRIAVIPDAFLDGQVLDFASRFVQLSAVNETNNRTSQRVVASTDPVVSPRSLVFTHETNAGWSNELRMRGDLNNLANEIELTFLGGAEAPQIGRLVAYSVTGQELASSDTAPLVNGQAAVLSISRETYDIAYFVAYSPSEGGEIRLSNFQASVVSEPVAVTNRAGEFSFRPLPAGEYRFRTLPAEDSDLVAAEEFQDIELATGESVEQVDFGFGPANDPPIARNDFALTQEDSRVGIGVLINDTDTDGNLDEGSVVITQPPEHGVAEVTSSGFINYTPNENYFGRDTLLYTVRDDQGAVSNTAVVTLQVDSVNDPPVAMDDNLRVLGMTPTALNILGNDFDIDGELVPSTLRIVSAPANGTAVVDVETGVVTYTPTGSATSDSFTYTVDDAEGAVSPLATVSIERVSQGTPPVAVDDVAATLEGTATQITVTNNDTDADGTLDLNSVFIVALPSHGAVTVGDNGNLTYQPELGFIGTDTFSYRLHDNEGLVSNSADVQVTMSERDFPYQNPINSLDVDGDGNVSPRDVLFIIREIDDRTVSDASTGLITMNPVPGTRPDAYFDVDGNGFIIGRDVLAVVIRINELSEASAEPPASTLAAEMSVAASIFASNFDPFGDDEDELAA